MNEIANLPLPVEVLGISGTTLSLWGILAACLYLIIRSRPAMKKLQNEGDGSLRGDLLGRIIKLEQEQREEREQYSRELREERKTCDDRLSAMQAKMDAMTRQFVSFQIIVARALPPEMAVHAQQAADRLMQIIATDLDEYMPRELDELKPEA